MELNLTGKRVSIGLSAGINSMAVLMWLVEQEYRPSELHLYYAHFKEHSPDSFQFVADGIRYARKHFANVKIKITKNSVLEFFKGKQMIPHPKFSPCSLILKIEPMALYNWENQIEVDLIGYVKGELKRVKSSQKNEPANLFFTKAFPVKDFTDDWCFEIVLRHLGWYPKIYDIKDANGKRLFKHNNCLPCKNMTIEEMELVRIHYPEYFELAMKLSRELKAHWGRDADDFYTTFGKAEYETQPCEICTFD